jgi:hypothetical protein
MVPNLFFLSRSNCSAGVVLNDIYASEEAEGLLPGSRR